MKAEFEVMLLQSKCAIRFYAEYDKKIRVKREFKDEGQEIGYMNMGKLQKA